ncbi:LOW QUALITY PROTEIN: hypothetical protein QYF61_010098 [Mycteria americana]|uniref:Uncharacterized protein n=1 Tax=Mycteria americana TaxID=33587 RepID=A0AAN7NTS0_MYCAM|nr:LOW QUALITY PROTEIN: hypothetical protein QYF61_010098 [Mycteria americana]
MRFRGAALSLVPAWDEKPSQAVPESDQADEAELISWCNSTGQEVTVSPGLDSGCGNRLQLHPAMMSESISEAVTFHRQEDDSDEQNHCREVQGNSNVTPVQVLRAGHCQRDKEEGSHHRQKQNHRMLWIGRDLSRSSSSTPLQEQGHLQLGQVAQSPIQPDLECFQGWGLHYLSGQPIPVPHHSQLLEGCYKVSPEASLLQAEQPHLSQPVLVAEVLQPLDHFHGPPLDLLQQLHVFLVLRAPELDAVLQVTVGLLGCERTLLAHVQLFVHQYPQGCSRSYHCLTCIETEDFPDPGDPALGLVEPHEVHTGPLLQLVQVPLDDIPSFWHVNCTTRLGVICKLAEGALDLAVNVIDENIEQRWSQYGPLKDTTSVDRYPLDATIQPIPYPLNSPPIKSVSLQFREKDVVGDHVPRVVTNLIFPYSGMGFTPLVPNMLSIDSGGKPFLLFFASLAKFSRSCALAFLTPSLHKQAASLYSFQITCPCFHCLCSSLLLFSLTSIHARLFPSLPDFLHLGTESSCTLWKASLKICQLCSASLSVRTISQGVLLTNSLKSWNFAFLKFRVLTVLLACPLSLRTVNSTNA